MGTNSNAYDYLYSRAKCICCPIIADLFPQGLVNKRIFTFTYIYDEALAKIKNDYNWYGVCNYDCRDAFYDGKM